MKTLSSLLIAALSLFPNLLHGAQSAQARLYCQSLRFYGARDNGSGYYVLTLTTLPSGINNELMPNGSTYASYFELYDDAWGDTYTGTIFVTLPASQDANGNGHNDFFEVSQSASGSGSGNFYVDGGGGGTVQAAWGRSAGSVYGICELTLSGVGQFPHTFELIEYTGQLSYTPAASTVPGTLALARTGNPSSLIGGPATFVKVSANQLTLQTNTWTDEWMQNLVLYVPQTFTRRTQWPTNYSGTVEFFDGDLNTVEEDYYLWGLSINDSNDADHDGIPDFSDDLALPPPRRPTLSLTRGTGNLWLTICGDTGHVHQIQELSTLTSTNWVTVLTTNLTVDPTVVTLPLPASTPKFWRAVAQ